MDKESETISKLWGAVDELAAGAAAQRAELAELKAKLENVFEQARPARPPAPGQSPQTLFQDPERGKKVLLGT